MSVDKDLRRNVRVSVVPSNLVELTSQIVCALASCYQIASCHPYLKELFSILIPTKTGQVNPATPIWKVLKLQRNLTVNDRMSL